MAVTEILPEPQEATSGPRTGKCEPCRVPVRESRRHVRPLTIFPTFCYSAGWVAQKRGGWQFLLYGQKVTRTNRVAGGKRKSYRVWEVVKLAQ